ncbi:hypothetical protein B5G26_09605 [Anaerotignum lactatifermentans]|uniref:Uncharacterized protein n=1 Tax=Anaerotignum lactatifermentans TaxID=160404 RepID=A0A1Y3U725_9FIRM|nr:hypothetical protein B5G26_09605 [Anaerotignum lactatifermentans]
MSWKFLSNRKFPAFFTEKTDYMFLYAKSTKRTYVFIMHLHKKEKNPESTLKHIAKCDII